MNSPVNIFWFRRDLRLHDNHGLFKALQSGLSVLPVFFFDKNILDDLKDRSDARVNFIHQKLQELKRELEKIGSSLFVFYGTPNEAFEILSKNFPVKEVFTNHDYEPYAIQRDEGIRHLLGKKGIKFRSFKDQVIFEKDEVVKDDGKPYTIYTPYSNKWLSLVTKKTYESFVSESFKNRFLKTAPFDFPSLEKIGFEKNGVHFPAENFNAELIRPYEQTRNFPGQEGTSRLGLHLRFGTISIRQLAAFAAKTNLTFLKELIWREFFMQILFHYPFVVTSCFRKKYDNIKWLNHEAQFQLWCEGKTGYPMVDAGMRELNETGFMHNRVRMITASFLVKHLLIDWRWGEAYFAEKLLDFELASNNGNWQWAAGTGCDAAPYFRVFNPAIQQEKFDPEWKYIKKWVPEFGTDKYPQPMIEHAFARDKAIKAYKAVG